MDTTHEILYNMNDKKPKQVASKEIPNDIVRLVYEHSIEIKQLQHQAGDVSQLNESISSMKSDMRTMKTGTNMDFKSMKSHFTNKIEILSVSVETQIKGLNDTFDIKLVELKASVDKNNGWLKWVRAGLFTLMIMIPGTLLIGINATNKTNIGYQKLLDKRWDLFVETDSISKEKYKTDLLEIKKIMADIQQSMKK